jgi:hypothetical protein
MVFIISKVQKLTRLSYGPMHLILLNVVRGMFFVWKGASKCDKTAPPDVDAADWEPQPYVLDQRQWNEIGEELLASRKRIPAVLGRAPQNPSVQKLRVSISCLLGSTVHTCLSPCSVANYVDV